MTEEHSIMVYPTYMENGTDEFTCRHNHGVVCKEQYDAKCRWCGWNPENKALLAQRVRKCLEEK